VYNQLRKNTQGLRIVSEIDRMALVLRRLYMIGSTNKGPEMVTSKETKKMDKCR